MFNKRYGIILVVLTMVLLISGCKMSVDYSGEKKLLVYNDVVFSETDAYGRNVSAVWLIPEEESTHSVPVYYGQKSDSKRTNNTFAEAYDENDLKMFLVFGPPAESDKLYYDSSFTLPDYREGSPIEAIRLRDNETTVTIEEQQIIKRFTKALKMAADDNAQMSDISDNMKDYLIDIKYLNCGAWYSYGRLVDNSNGQLSIECYDVNAEGVYTLSEEDSAILGRLGLSL